MKKGEELGEEIEKPPSHFSAAMKVWFIEVQEDRNLEGHDMLLLKQACEAHDRAAQAQRAIKKYGLLVKDRYGALKPNPAITIENTSRKLFAQMCRELRLSHEPVLEGPRRPRNPEGK